MNQSYVQREDSYSASADLTYTEPLGKNFFLLGSYRFNWSNSQTEKDTRDILEDGTVSDELDSVYSSRMENTFLRHRMQLSFMKQEKKYNLQLGVNAQPSTTITRDDFNPGRNVNYTVWNFAPSARFDYNFDKNEFMRINYNGSTSQPSVNQLMPVPDNSDPLYVSVGNMSLKPEFSSPSSPTGSGCTTTIRIWRVSPPIR